MTAHYSTTDLMILMAVGTIMLAVVGLWIAALACRYSLSGFLVRWAAVDVPLCLVWAALAWWLAG